MTDQRRPMGQPGLRVAWKKRDEVVTQLTYPEVMRRLERMVQINGSMRAAALSIGVSVQTISAALKSRRSLGPKVLGPMGLRRRVIKEIIYEECKRAQPKHGYLRHQADAGERRAEAGRGAAEGNGRDQGSAADL